MLAPIRTAPASRDVGCVCVASLIYIVLNRMGAVIREKSVLGAYCVRSLVDTRSVLTGDLQRKKEQGYTKGTVILVRETLKPLKTRKHVVMYR